MRYTAKRQTRCQISTGLSSSPAIGARKGEARAWRLAVLHPSVTSAPSTPIRVQKGSRTRAAPGIGSDGGVCHRVRSDYLLSVIHLNLQHPPQPSAVMLRQSSNSPVAARAAGCPAALCNPPTMLPGGQVVVPAVSCGHDRLLRNVGALCGGVIPPRRTGEHSGRQYKLGNNARWIGNSYCLPMI